MPFDIFAEFLPTSHRGKHLLVIEYFWTAGSLMTPLFAYFTLAESWRLFVILVSYVLTFILLILMHFLYTFEICSSIQLSI